MGTRVAPSFANLFMAHFESKFVKCYKPGPIIWYRYIDDIFCIFNHGEEKLTNFIFHLNNCHPTIKFTYEYGTKDISFLDTKVSIAEGKLVTNLYTKPTDSHNYLLFTSSHPTHIKKAIPYSQFLRVRRICTNIEDFVKNCENLKQHFHRRGYPQELVEQSYKRAFEKSRDSLLHPQIKHSQEEKTSDDHFLITTYSPGLTTPRDIVNKNWPLLGTSNTTMELYDSRVIHGNRRCKNLSSILVRARVPDLVSKPPREPDTPLNPCTTKKCNYCPRLNKTGTITSSVLAREYKAKSNVSCKSNNIIYCITCKTCKKQYVGQTKNRLIDRFGKHFYHIKKIDRNLPIGKHFNLPSHKGIDDMEIHIVDFIYAAPNSGTASKLRDKIEKNWILRLRTFAPFGINTMDIKKY
jgi:hypothetical protein